MAEEVEDELSFEAWYGGAAGVSGRDLLRLKGENIRSPELMNWAGTFAASPASWKPSEGHRRRLGAKIVARFLRDEEKQLGMNFFLGLEERAATHISFILVLS